MREIFNIPIMALREDETVNEVPKRVRWFFMLVLFCKHVFGYLPRNIDWQRDFENPIYHRQYIGNNMPNIDMNGASVSIQQYSARRYFQVRQRQMSAYVQHFRCQMKNKLHSRKRFKPSFPLTVVQEADIGPKSVLLFHFELVLLVQTFRCQEAIKMAFFFAQTMVMLSFAVI